MNISLSAWKRENDIPKDLCDEIESILDIKYKPLSKSNISVTNSEIQIRQSEDYQCIDDRIKIHLTELDELNNIEAKLSSFSNEIEKSSINQHNLQIFTQLSDESTLFIKQKQHIENILLEIEIAKNHYMNEKDYYNNISFLNDFKGLKDFYKHHEDFLRLCKNNRTSLAYFIARPGYKDANIQIHRHSNVELRIQHILKEMFKEYHDLQLQLGYDAIKNMNFVNVTKTELIEKNIVLNEKQLNSFLTIILFLHEPIIGQSVKPELISKIFEQINASNPLVSLKNSLHKTFIGLELHNNLSKKINEAFDILLTAKDNQEYIKELKDYYAKFLLKLDQKLLDLFNVQIQEYDHIFCFQLILMHLSSYVFAKKFSSCSLEHSDIYKFLQSLTYYGDKILQSKVKHIDIENIYANITLIKNVLNSGNLLINTEAKNLDFFDECNRFIEYISTMYKKEEIKPNYKIVQSAVYENIEDLLDTQLNVLSILLIKIKSQEFVNKNPNFEIKNYQIYDLSNIENKNNTSSSFVLISYLYNKLKELNIEEYYSDYIKEILILAIKRLITASEIFKKEKDSFIFLIKNLYGLNYLLNSKPKEFVNVYIFEPILILDDQLLPYISEVTSDYGNMTISKIISMTLSLVISYNITRMSKYFALIFKTCSEENFINDLEKDIRDIYNSVNIFFDDNCIDMFLQIFPPYLYTSLVEEINKTNITIDRTIISRIFDIIHQ